MKAHPIASLLCDDVPPESILAFGAAGDVTWSEFTRDIDGLVRDMEERSAQRWVLCFSDAYYFAVALLAALQAEKHAVVPGNLQADAVAEIMEEGDGLLHDGVIETSFGEAIRLPLSSDGATLRSFRRLDPARAKITLLTSGSTGEPKPVTKILPNLEAEILTLEKMWGRETDGCRIVSTVSHQHIYGMLFRLLWPLCAGRPFDRGQLLYPEQVVARSRTDAVLVSSPAMLRRLDGEAAERYRIVFSSGGPLPREAASDSLARLGSLPVEVYGSTETGGIAWRRQDREAAPWEAFPGIEIATSPSGCLRLRSPYISSESWYETSDLCRMEGDRRFHLSGRIDRVVKIEEKRVSLPEIEKRLCGLDLISDAAVLQIAEAGGAVLAAVLALTPAGRAQMEVDGKGRFWLRLRKELRTWLEPAAVPRRFRVVDELPVDSQGKKTIRNLKNLFTDTQ